MKSWIITKKDLRLLCRDKRALVVLVMLPLVFITIIGLTTGKLLGWSDSNKIIKIALHDNIDYENIGIDGPFFQDEINDPTPFVLELEEGDDDFDPDLDQLYDKQERKELRTAARNLVVKIANKLQEMRGVKIVEVQSKDEADQLVRDDEVNASLTFGPKFFQRFYHLELSDLFLSDNGRLKNGLESLDIKMDCKQPDSGTFAIEKELVRGNTYKEVMASLICQRSAIRNQITSKIEEINKANPDSPPLEDPCFQLDEEKKSEPLAILPYQQPKTDGPENNVYQELIPSYTVLFTFFLVNIMARSFIHERETGTLKRLQIAPIRPSSLLAGKTIPFLVISLIQSFLLFTCGKLMFGMSWGNEALYLLPVIFCTSMAATSLGLLVATFVRTESQVSATANLVVITMAGMSGCFMPRKWLPVEMQDFSLSFPHAWSLIAYNQLLAQATPDLREVIICCIALIGFALLYFVLGSLRFEKVT